MKCKFNKISIMSVLIIVSLLMNVFQHFKFSSYENRYQSNADSEFNIAMQLISIGIENLKTKETDQLSTLATLSSGTSRADAIYPFTSYYKKNPILKTALWELNNNITNKKNIRYILEKKDLSVLLPTLDKVRNNPIDETIAKDLYHLVQNVMF